MFIFYYDEIQMLCLLFNTTAPLNIYIFKFIKNIFTKFGEKMINNNIILIVCPVDIQVSLFVFDL